MSRYQFYEALVRVAYMKFTLNKIAENTYDAVKMLLDIIKN